MRRSSLLLIWLLTVLGHIVAMKERGESLARVALAVVTGAAKANFVCDA